jgi:fatty acid synthase
VAEVERFTAMAEKNGLKLFSRRTDSITSSQLLFRKLKPELKETEVIHIKSNKYEEWVERVKETILENKESEKAKNIWLIANDTSINGIIGLSNCLRLESGGHHIRCIFDYDNQLPKTIDFERSPYCELRKLDLTTNIYQNGNWGTLRHISLPKEQETIDTEHAYLNVVQRGDMSSLKWFDAHHKYFPDLPENERNEKEVLCQVYYSALNFKVIITSKVLFYLILFQI